MHSNADHLHPASAYYGGGGGGGSGFYGAQHTSGGPAHYHPAYPSHLSMSHTPPDLADMVVPDHLAVALPDMLELEHEEEPQPQSYDFELELELERCAAFPPHTPFPDSAYHCSPSPSPPPPTGVRTQLTSLAHRLIQRYIVPHLPHDLQAIAANPPDLTRPETLVPVLRALAPYTQFLLVLVALYIVWAVVAGFIGYIARFMRFCFRIGPVIALVAWVMAASGQGGVDVLFEALKQYAGEAAGGQAPQRHRGPPPGRQPATGYYAGSSDGGSRTSSSRTRDGHRRRSGGSSSGSDSSFWDAPPRTNNQRNRPGSASRAGGYDQNQNNQQGAAAGGDLLSMFLGAAGGDGLGAQVQGFVRQAVARGVGLEWLLGVPAPAKQEEKERSR